MNAAFQEYVPAIGDLFVMNWKTIYDRSYINTVWRCTAVKEGVVVGMRVVGERHYGSKSRMFRTFDCAFNPTSQEIVDALAETTAEPLPA